MILLSCNKVSCYNKKSPFPDYSFNKYNQGKGIQIFDCLFLASFLSVVEEHAIESNKYHWDT